MGKTEQFRYQEGLKLKVMTMKGTLEPGYEKILDEKAETIQSSLKI